MTVSKIVSHIESQCGRRVSRSGADFAVKRVIQAVDITFRMLLVAGLLLSGCSRNSHAEGPRPTAFAPGITANIAFDGHLTVDQFGYRPADTKICVIRNPR